MNIMSWRPGPWLVLWVRIRTRFLPWYSRRLAAEYEAKRRGTMWRGETEAFHRLYDAVRPGTVLDVPVGTGRWFDWYRERGAAVLGVDLSGDMLEEASKKIRPGDDIRLQQGDVLNPARVHELGRDHDLVVCTRFAHWLRPGDLPGLARNLAATGARHLIIGARVTSDGTPPKGGAGARRLLKKMFSRKVLTSFVHEEDELLLAFADAGWRPVDRKPIMQTRRFRYFFYLLEQDPFASG